MKVEFIQGKNLANAANKAAALEHLIWSTLPNTLKISNGKYPVPHFDAKAKIDDYIKSVPGLFAKTTFLWVTFYASVLRFPMYTPNLLVSELIRTITNFQELRACRNHPVNMCLASLDRQQKQALLLACGMYRWEVGYFNTKLVSCLKRKPPCCYSVMNCCSHYY